MGIEVLEGSRPEDVRRWEELVDGAPLGDVYHRPGYVLAHAAAGHGRAVALVVSRSYARLLVPLLIRQGLPLPGGGTAADAFSPYGYGGLLSLQSLEPPPLEDMAGLVESVREWCASQGIICCVLRMHPLLKQHTWFDHLDSAQHGMLWHFRGPTVAVELADWNEDSDCLRGARKGRRSDLALARKHLRVSWSNPRDPESVAAHVKVFCEIYNQTMSRLEADDFYEFPAVYYTTLAAGLGEHVGVAVAWRGEESVGAAIFLRGRHYAHYHLSGASDAGRRTKAATLLVNAGAAWARQRGCRLLHLGGGMREKDSLLDFKQSFGGRTYNCLTLSIVADQRRYDLLRHGPDPPWPYDKAGASARSANMVLKATRTPAPVIGIGAGGHARVILDILQQQEHFRVVGLLAPNADSKGWLPETVAILGDETLLAELWGQGVRHAFLGIGSIGDNHPRAKLFEQVRALGFEFVNAIHPSAVVAKSANLGHGVAVMAGAVINPGASLGDNVIVNSGAIVEHDCVIEDHVHIAPGATLSGSVKVGRYSHIGTGASVRQGIHIGENALVAAGAVVVHDVPDGDAVAGVPGRPMAVRQFNWRGGE
jgi:UDP-perosamine 4-acetyltransferase